MNMMALLNAIELTSSLNRKYIRPRCRPAPRSSASSWTVTAEESRQHHHAPRYRLAESHVRVDDVGVVHSSQTRGSAATAPDAFCGSTCPMSTPPGSRCGTAIRPAVLGAHAVQHLHRRPNVIGVYHDVRLPLRVATRCHVPQRQDRVDEHPKEHLTRIGLVP